MDARKLADELIKKGALSDELAQRLINEAVARAFPFEKLLYEKRIVDEVSVAEAKAIILNIPYQKIDPTTVTDELLKLVPEDTARSYSIAPISRNQDMVIVGMVNPDNVEAQEALKFLAKQNKISLGVYVVTPTDLELIMRRYVPFEKEIQQALKAVNIKVLGQSMTMQKVVSLDEEKSSTEEAPVIKIVSSLLRAAVDQKASDIHIEPQRGRLRIRFRLDGALKEIQSLPIELLSALVARVKVLADLKIDESRIPQDGRFRTVIFGRDVDYRVATLPTPLGEKVVIRVLDPLSTVKNLSDLGIVGQNAEWIEEALDKPFGMVLVTGPTGSGKTTTLYAFLQQLNQEDVNIMSMEDPVEYFVDGVNQSQMKSEIGYTFAAALRQALRQDPDIIMVGEIRDGETAGLAVQAALTGHTVLSTLHTNNAAGVIPRFIDMKVAPYLLPPALSIMIAQRLTRRLCPNCKKPQPATPEETKIIEDTLKDMAPKIRESATQKTAPFQIWVAPGCDVCKGKGTKGRMAIYEVMKMTRELEDIIQKEPSEGRVRDEGKRQGMITLRQDGILKVLQGFIGMNEVLRETEAVNTEEPEIQKQ